MINVVVFLFLLPGTSDGGPLAESPDLESSAVVKTTGPVDSGPDESEEVGEAEADEYEVQVWEITTVSKKAEPLWRAPGVASAIGISEIEAYGLASLGEIWATMAGVQNTFGTGINRTSIRGGDPNASVFHTLVLIDGRPVRTSGGNLSAYSPPYTFPTLQIDHIEVSRGPGSVMHGTNAFEGVFNIVTRKSQENGFRALVEGGSFDTTRGEIAGSYNRGDFSIDGGLLFADTEGWPFESAAVAGGTFSKDVLQENIGLNTSVNYKGLKLSIFHGDMKQFAMLALQPDDPLSFESEVSMIDLSYQKLVGMWNLEAHLTLNHEDFAWLFGDTPVLPFHTNDLLAEFMAFGRVGQIDVTSGIILQRLDTFTNGGSVSTPYEGETYVYSLYSQFQYQPNDHLDLTLGFQANQIDRVDATVMNQPANVPTDFDTDVVPRLGVVWSLNPDAENQHGFKFLYGEAFRSPSLLEYVIDTPGFQLGNPNLVPETIATWDLQFFSYGPKYEASIAAYSSTQEDLIIFIPNENYILGAAENVAELDSEGIELEFEYKPSQRFFAQFSYTWQDNEEKTGKSRASLLPSTNWKLGMGYKMNRVSMSLFNQHDGAYKEDLGAPILNPPSEAVDIITLNCDVQLIRGRMDMDLNLRANNLLDEEIWVPDFLGGAANTVPGGPGRAFYATLKLTR